MNYFFSLKFIFEMSRKQRQRGRVLETCGKTVIHLHFCLVSPRFILKYDLVRQEWQLSWLSRY